MNEKILKAIFCAGIFLGRVVAEVHDFQEYQLFKSESRSGASNSKCVCSQNSTVPGFEWESWSKCQGHSQEYRCHRGIQYRSRICSSNDEPGNVCKEREWKYCYDEHSCYGQWQQWSRSLYGGECSHTCGGGVRVKVRACTLNHEIGLFCKGKYRSPFDLKKESCNTLRCPDIPTWSEWEVVFTNCSSSTQDGIILSRRTCKLLKSNPGRGCGMKNLKEETSTRKCKDDGESSTYTPFGQEKSNQDFSLNTLVYILLATIALLMLLLIALGLLVFKNKQVCGGETVEFESLKKKQIEAYDNNRRQTKYLSFSENGTASSRRQAAQSYDEIEIESNSTNKASKSNGLQNWIKQDKYENSQIPEDPSYTYMCSSSTLGSRGQSSVKTSREESEISPSPNMIVSLPNEECTDRYTIRPPPPLPPFIESELSPHQHSTKSLSDTSIRESNGERRRSREKSGKRSRRETKRESPKNLDDETDVDYANASRKTSSSKRDNLSDKRTARNGSSQRNRHLYAEIGDYKSGDTAGTIRYAEIRPKRAIRVTSG